MKQNGLDKVCGALGAASQSGFGNYEKNGKGVVTRRALLVSAWAKLEGTTTIDAVLPRVENCGMKKLLVLATIALMLLVAACQKAEAPVPTETDGEQVWHNVLEHDHGIELLSFKKMNGQLEGSHYLLYFEAQVKYLDNNIHDPVAAPGVGIRANRMGTVETVKASYEFQKTESGWKGQDGHVYAFGQ